MIASLDRAVLERDRFEAALREKDRVPPRHSPDNGEVRRLRATATTLAAELERTRKQLSRTKGRAKRVSRPVLDESGTQSDSGDSPEDGARRSM